MFTCETLFFFLFKSRREGKDKFMGDESFVNLLGLIIFYICEKLFAWNAFILVTRV